MSHGNGMLCFPPDQLTCHSQVSHTPCGTMDSCGGKKTFMDVFKFYKRKDVHLNLESVFDSHMLKDEIKVKMREVEPSRLNVIEDWEAWLGLKHPSKWKVIELCDKPGLLIIQNPFTKLGARYWIVRCLKYLTQKPSRLNIDAHDLIPSHEQWWEYCLREQNTGLGTIMLQKLRWATIGYHHNWDTKKYSEELKSEFPTDLNALCKNIACILGFSEFNAEAGIINFYHLCSTLSAHTDHSEENSTAPLFSFSFGQSAIFLVGGATKEIEPVPILLHNGDIIVMSEESRLCYHGVPRIMTPLKKSWESAGSEDNKMLNCKYYMQDVLDELCDNAFWEPFGDYINNNRINMNVRQVLFPGQPALLSNSVS